MAVALRATSNLCIPVYIFFLSDLILVLFTYCDDFHGRSMLTLILQDQELSFSIPTESRSVCLLRSQRAQQAVHPSDQCILIQGDLASTITSCIKKNPSAMANFHFALTTKAIVKNS